MKNKIGLIGLFVISILISPIVLAQSTPICGDVNCDKKVNSDDVTLLQNYVGYPGKYTICSEWAADVTCDGVIDVGDVALLFNHVNYSEDERYALRCCNMNNEPNEPTTVETEKSPDWIINKAEQYIISLVGKTYYNEHFSLVSSAITGKGVTEYLVYYTFDFPENVQNSLGTGVNTMQVKLDQKGNIVEYRGPTRAYNFLISKEQAITLAQKAGLKQPTNAEIVFGKDHEIDEGYVWEVWTDVLNKGELEIVYLDVDTGEVIATKEAFHAERKLLHEDFPSSSSEYPQITDQWCDAANPCPEGLECFSFPGIGLRCAQTNPCSYFRCPEGTQCSVAESYPGQVICSGKCEGKYCEAGVSYNAVTGKVEVMRAGRKEPTDVTIRTAPGYKGILETPTISVKASGELVIEESKLLMKTSVGKKPINIMPEDAITVSATPDKKLIKEIELREESQKPVYSVKGIKQARLLFIIPVSMEIETKIDAETKDVISVNKPWWSFLCW